MYFISMITFILSLFNFVSYWLISWPNQVVFSERIIFFVACSLSSVLHILFFPAVQFCVIIVIISTGKKKMTQMACFCGYPHLSFVLLLSPISFGIIKPAFGVFCNQGGYPHLSFVLLLLSPISFGIIKPAFGVFVIRLIFHSAAPASLRTVILFTNVKQVLWVQRYFDCFFLHCCCHSRKYKTMLSYRLHFVWMGGL